MNRPASQHLTPRQVLMTEALPPFYRIALGILVFSAFLTQAKFITSIRNNVGPFEVLGLLLIVVFLSSPRTHRPLVLNGATKAALGILAITLISQVNIVGHRRGAGLIHIAIQLFFALFLVTLLNLLRQYRVSPDTLLKWVGLALLVVGPWIIGAGLSDQQAVQDAGPFRNRAHMASYMLTAFWIALMYSQWPRLRLIEKVIAYSGVVMTLYAVAVTGRRSVYLSLLLGVAVLGASFLVASRSNRGRLVVAGLLVAGLIYSMYQYGPRYLPQLQFFQTRVGMIDDRLEAAVAVSEETAVTKGFFELQRQGVRQAFFTHPLLGIGWGGFARSSYSPTGHEVHSTPMRFLAETGLAGLSLYILFMIALLRSVWAGFLRMRKTPFGNAYLVLAVGFSSLLISYIYNRHVTERTFWLLTAVIFAAELFADRAQALVRKIGSEPPTDERATPPLAAPATRRVSEPFRPRDTDDATLPRDSWVTPFSTR